MCAYNEFLKTAVLITEVVLFGKVREFLLYIPSRF